MTRAWKDREKLKKEAGDEAAEVPEAEPKSQLVILALSNGARTEVERVETFSSHLAGIGKGLSSALKSYNQAVGSFDARVMPSARRVEELEDPGHHAKPLSPLLPVEETPRAAEATPPVRKLSGYSKPPEARLPED